MPMNQSLIQAMRNRPARGLPPNAAGSSIIPPPGIVTEPAGPRARERSPLIDLLPLFETIHAYFIQVPVDLTDGPASWNTAAYGLKSVQVGRDFGSELGLFGLDATLLPPDTTGVGPARNSKVATTWCGGDKTARQAAVVVGVDLPINVGEWQGWDGPPVPGVHDGATGLISGQGRGQVLWFGHFPPGNLDPTSGPIQFRTFAKSWAPYIRRITMGQRIDVALVLQRSALTWGTEDAVICGYAAVQLSVGVSTNMQRWGE